MKMGPLHISQLIIEVYGMKKMDFREVLNNFLGSWWGNMFGIRVFLFNK